eukprot:6128551-Ditylum_brightwellii.AAC.1
MQCRLLFWVRKAQAKVADWNVPHEVGEKRCVTPKEYKIGLDMQHNKSIQVRPLGEHDKLIQVRSLGKLLLHTALLQTFALLTRVLSWALLSPFGVCQTSTTSIAWSCGSGLPCQSICSRSVSSMKIRAAIIRSAP